MEEPGPAPDALLEFAFATAEPRGMRVRAARALPLSSLVPYPHTMAAGRPDSRYQAEERAQLAATLAPWRDKFPDVPVTEQVSTGPAAAVLLYAAARRGLVVVGRRHNPSHLTWKLGPVGAHRAAPRTLPGRRRPARLSRSASEQPGHAIVDLIAVLAPDGALTAWEHRAGR
ncbi:universal stress protein [Streptomyces sp. NPDC057280]|uniref:universal stress protein n=1 Tax=Streptomyces sp. NPDC057280 TaxID=3346081 RepID=UPI003629CFB6